MIRKVIGFLRDWWGLLLAIVVATWLVFSGLPMLYQWVYHTPVSGFYFMVALPTYLTLLGLLPLFGIVWHVYKESTDPLAIAVRERVAREFMESKQWEGLMDRLVKAEMQRVLDFYFPPLRGSVKEKIKEKTYRIAKYVKTHVQ